jgi:hypothetical protein
MVTMESVIERGQARCPRCVAVADYFFVEVSTNLLRYEVNCGRCGERYREEHGPVPPVFGAVATVDEWLPATPRMPIRQRIQVRVAAARSIAMPASIKLTASALLLLLKRARYQ